MRTVHTDRFQKSLVLYFMHGNALDYKKAAYLYASLVIHEEQAGDLYLNYREQMVAFTWEQLMKRHITESLRTLYKRFCKEMRCLRSVWRRCVTFVIPMK